MEKTNIRAYTLQELANVLVQHGEKAFRAKQICGLSISRDFVEAHGGTLTVESELGKGSRFVMRLKA